MAKHIGCGDVVPGCQFTAQAATEEELLDAVKAHAVKEHGVKTTYDPDTQVRDPGVLRRIVREFGGAMALDCSVVTGGWVRVGDPVALL